MNFGELLDSGLKLYELGSVGLTIHQFLEAMNTGRMLRESESLPPEWAAALEQQLQRLEEERKRDAEAFDAKLRTLVEDPQFGRVVSNVGFEFAREALDERCKMLLYAAAGLFNVQLTVGELSRVERTLRELDPRHVLRLDQLIHGSATVGALHVDPELEVLVAAGCARISGGLPPVPQIHVAVTHTGRLVAKVLRGYVHASRPS